MAGETIFDGYADEQAAIAAAMAPPSSNEARAAMGRPMAHGSSGPSAGGMPTPMNTGPPPMVDPGMAPSGYSPHSAALESQSTDDMVAGAAMVPLMGLSGLMLPTNVRGVQARADQAGAKAGREARAQHQADMAGVAAGPAGDPEFDAAEARYNAIHPDAGVIPGQGGGGGSSLRMVDPGGIKASGYTVQTTNGVEVPPEAMAMLAHSQEMDRASIDRNARMEIAERAAKSEASQEYAGKIARVQAMRRENEMSRGRAVRNQMVQVQKAMFDMNQKVDPQRFWKSLTGGQRAMRTIGIALGASSGGQNVSFASLQGSIRDDIQAQMSDLQSAKQRGVQANTALSAFRSMLGDERAAEQAMEAQVYSSLMGRVEQLMAGVKDERTRANAEAMHAKLSMSMHKSLLEVAKLQYGKRTLTENFKRYSPQYAGGGGGGKKGKYVPTYKESLDDEDTFKYSKEIDEAKNEARQLRTFAELLRANPEASSGFLDEAVIAHLAKPDTSTLVRGLGKLLMPKQSELAGAGMMAHAPSIRRIQGASATTSERAGEFAKRTVREGGLGKVTDALLEAAEGRVENMTQGLSTQQRLAHGFKGSKTRMGTSPSSEPTDVRLRSRRTGAKLK